MKHMTLNLGHTLKYDSKTQTFFFNFCTTSTKILFSPHFQTVQIIEYGPLKFFPHIPFENIYFYVPQNEKKKSKLIFWTVWLFFSRWITYFTLLKQESRFTRHFNCHINFPYCGQTYVCLPHVGDTYFCTECHGTRLQEILQGLQKYILCLKG